MLKLNHKFHFGIIAAIFAITTTSFVHAGHDHSGHSHGTSPTVPNFPTSTFTPRSSPQQLNGNSPGVRFNSSVPLQNCTSCSCETNNRLQSNTEMLPSANFSFSQPTNVNFSSTTELEQLAVRLSATLNNELQGNQYYSSIMADANGIVRVTQNLNQSEGRGATSEMLINEARPIVMPLQRLSQFLRNSQTNQSQQAVNQLGESLVIWAREKQSPSTIGSSPPLPRNNSMTPLRENSIPRQNVIIPEEMKGIALLPASEQSVAIRQKTCPVTGGPLGSMGKPILVSVAGRSIYVCCQGCVSTLQESPEKYL